MIKCRVCGAELHDNAKECPNCRVWQEQPVEDDKEG